MAEKYDVAVIGSGPGGYVAAIRSAQLGLRTVCIEKSKSLGGTCLNVGCIPSKCLLQSSEHYHMALHGLKEHGIDFTGVKADFDKMMQRKNTVVESFGNGVAGLFKKNKVERLQGVGKLVSESAIEVDDGAGGKKTIEARNIILATGSEPVSLPFLPVDEKTVVTSTGALSLSKVPKSLIVVGGGVIGVELASVYARLGAEVTVVEMLDMICAGMDDAVAKGLLKILKQQGLKFHLSSKVESADSKKAKTTLAVKTPEESLSLEAAVVLVAVGRRPCSKGLGLDAVGIETQRNGTIAVNGNFQTKHAHIYAIGDLISGPMLAHKASEEGVAVAEIIAGHRAHINYMAIPNIIYTSLEAAGVGLTEKEAKELGCTVKTGTFPFRGNSRARCLGDVEGFVKIVEDGRTGHLVGMHILGHHAGEMIHEGVVAIEKRTTVRELAAMCHGHPTLSEAVKEAALATDGLPIHM